MTTNSGEMAQDEELEEGGVEEADVVVRVVVGEAGGTRIVTVTTTSMADRATAVVAAEVVPLRERIRGQQASLAALAALVVQQLQLDRRFPSLS